MIRRRRSKRRDALHPVDRPIRRPGWTEWFMVNLIIDGFLLLVRGIAWIVGAAFRAFP